MFQARIARGCGVAAVLLWAGTAQAQFTLFSQNALHLGWGHDDYLTDKNAYMTASVVKKSAPNWDVAIIQEVMYSDTVSDLYPSPGKYLVASIEPQGASSYKESYAFLVRKPTKTNTCCTVTKKGTSNVTTYSGSGFSRPPAGIVVKQAKKEAWVIDYHAVFGGVSGRRAEVEKIANVVPAFQSIKVGSSGGHTVKAYIVGGDWNFPADDDAFVEIKSKLGTTVKIEPRVLTSLKRNGDLSSSYDHFLWDSNKITGTSAASVPPPGGKDYQEFRSSFSDHLGIKISVKIIK